ncbi:11366_t:CDS:1 [Diversispora eburnea]|uniref:11366_t:CDS:1 n=1 Tax=Diversispora eburnea TaxID=1213867 RepID=A0A9N8YMD6_9GLOM|nr:11366_t:CDS:1 [Diversispora eburnea]
MNSNGFSDSSSNEINEIFNKLPDSRQSNKKSIRVFLQNINLLPNKSQPMVKSFINKYPLVETTLELLDICTSVNTRSKRKIPRPQNAFILFRKNIHKEFKDFLTFEEISKLASHQWKSADKYFWNELSRISKSIHSLKNPGYIYNPRDTNEPNPNVPPIFDGYIYNPLLNPNTQIFNGFIYNFLPNPNEQPPIFDYNPLPNNLDFYESNLFKES